MIGGGSRCLGGGVWATGKRERIRAEPGGANEKQEDIQSDRAPAWSSWPRRSGAQSGVHSVTAGAVEPPYGRQDTSCHLKSISYSMRLYKNIIQNTCDTCTDFLSFPFGNIGKKILLQSYKDISQHTWCKGKWVLMWSVSLNKSRLSFLANTKLHQTIVIIKLHRYKKIDGQIDRHIWAQISTLIRMLSHISWKGWSAHIDGIRGKIPTSPRLLPENSCVYLS